MDYKLNIVKVLKFLTLILIFFTSPENIQAHSNHYKKLKSIKYEIFFNDKLVGNSFYTFDHKNNIFNVRNKTDFEVKLLGKNIFSFSGESTERFVDGKFDSFEYKSLQNKKKKFAKVFFDKNENNFKIFGSSFEGIIDKQIIIGDWWNHQILSSNKYISSISGSIYDQEVKFIEKEIFNINKKEVELQKFNIITSKSGEKKSDFFIWYDNDLNIIFKIQYNKFGLWEYRIKEVN